MRISDWSSDVCSSDLSDLFDRLLRFNVAGFVNKYSDLQSSVTKMGAVRPENITTNVAAAEIYGFEVETLLRPMDNFTLGANLAYLHARYTDFCADTNGVFTDGAPEPGPCGPAVPIDRKSPRLNSRH